MKRFFVIFSTIVQQGLCDRGNLMYCPAMNGDKYLVIGHRNPDTDSVCAAYAYAQLKNELAGKEVAIPLRCGPLTQQAEYVFNRAGVEPPVFVKDVYPLVADVMTSHCETASLDSPLADVIHILDERHVHNMPVVSEGWRYEGIISEHELVKLLAGSGQGRTRMFFSVENVVKVMGGRLLYRGQKNSQEVSVMIGAMPLEGFSRRVAKLDPASTLLIVGNRPDLIAHAIERRVEVLIVTGMGENDSPALSAGSLPGWIICSPHDTLETYRRLMLSTPVRKVMSSLAKTLSPEAHLGEAKAIFRSSSQRGIPVLEGDRLIGILTRSDLLKTIRKRLILVDHNELDQAVEGAEEAELCEIIDHHRFGGIVTTHPIHVYARPVGSSCTLIQQLFERAGKSPAPETAFLMMCSIVCDTVALKSPTATAEDEVALEALSRLAGFDWRSVAKDIFSKTCALNSRSAAELVSVDLKLYNEFGVSFGIGQIETTDLSEVNESLASLREELQRVRIEKGLMWLMLMVSDIIHSESVLVSSGFGRAEEALIYHRTPEGMFRLPGVLSRKKQLLPEVLRVLSETTSSARRQP